jgi:hypothetical protein
MANPIYAHDSAAQTVTKNFETAIPNIPGKPLISVEVDFAPGAASQPHTHAKSAFIYAYNYARRLKTLKGLTPCEHICKCWTSQPERLRLNPLQQMPGPNT